jgi:DNA repair protein RadA|tara:strand:+ start:18709 stop:19758 length:1050 start_codon:yes stop_codon:yes gene_type:complete
MKQVLMEPEVVEKKEKSIEKTVPVEKTVKPKVKEEDKTIKEKTLNDLPGVGPATIEKLEAVGYNDLMSVGVATPGEIIDATGMTEAAAKKIIASARASLDMGFESGEEVLKKRDQVVKLSTGSKNFDSLMDGGFESAAITECFGEYGSGKTQVGHILAVNCLKQYPNSAVVYIDTENTFRPERIEQLCKGLDLDASEALKNIKVARAYNTDHQMLLAEKVDDLIKKQGLDVKLVIMDSLTAHFRAEFIGRGTLAERQQKINRHMRDLAKLAHMNNLCVYVTNQVMAKPDMFFGDPTTAIGGHIVGHASTFRLYLRKGKKGSRVAKLVDSPNLPEGEASFYVETSGLKDI